jgi:uncharacterized protein (DUF58 family)
MRWISTLVTIFVVGLVFDVPGVTSFLTAVLAVMGIAYWWRSKSLDNVHYTRHFHYTQAFPDEEVTAHIEVENRKLLPLSWLRIRDAWPKAVGPVDEETLPLFKKIKIGQIVNVFNLRWFERVRREYRLKFRERGVHNVGPAQLESGDIFGIYKIHRKQESADKLTVFPRLIPMADLNLPSEDPFGDKRYRKRMFEDPNRPMGVREYRPEDEFRRVHWPATARTGKLQVKVYEPTSTQVMVVCLNVATSENTWEGVYEEMLEHLISLSATMLYQGLQDGYQIGLISNGAVGRADHSFRILPGRTYPHLINQLSILAGVSPIVTTSFERFLLDELSRVPYGATLVVVSAIISPALEKTLLQAKSRGRRVVLISLSEDEPPILPGIQIVHLPHDEFFHQPEKEAA